VASDSRWQFSIVVALRLDLDRHASRVSDYLQIEVRKAKGELARTIEYGTLKNAPSLLFIDTVTLAVDHFWQETHGDQFKRSNLRSIH